MESIESDGDLNSSENQTDPADETFGGDSQLQTEVDHVTAHDESIQVNLGDEPQSEVNITFNLEDEARVRVTVESLPPLDSPEEAYQKVVIESLADGGGNARSQPRSIRNLEDFKTYISRWPYSLGMTLFGLGILVYLVTHLVGLTRFPIYFFTDEAIQSVTAANLIRDKFLDEQGTLLPTYFKNGPYYNLSVSVYLQLLPYLFFGKSAFVTRATSVLVSLLAALSIGLMLRKFYKIPFWWLGVSLLSIAPAWFLHSRTAFETVIFCAFYAAFLYFYLLYRYRSAHYLLYAILFAALAFYSYSPGQILIGLTSFLLLLSDARYHWQNRSTLLSGVGLILILSLPYLRFRLNSPDAPTEQLRILDSYWLQNIPLSDKLAQFGSEYLYGLSPGYWFLPNERDLPRHLMKGYGHIFRAALPFAVLGLYLTLRGIKSPANRVLLIALLVAPAGAALVEIGITRVLVFIIPAIILIAIGLSKTLTWLEKLRLPHAGLSIALFTILTLINFSMLRDALTNAATWYEDYGLGGLQYGAYQIFPKIQTYLDAEPELEIVLTPTWANGTDVVARFFLGDPLPIKMGSIDGHMFQKKPTGENTLFVMTADEYELMLDSGKFELLQIEETLPYPNGEAGFYFVRLDYVDEIDSILETEREQRRELRYDKIALEGEFVQARYSMLDIGEIAHMFDGDQHTLARTFEANPAIVELTFPKHRSVSGVSVIIGSTEAEVRALLYPDSDSPPTEHVKTFQGTVEQPEVVFDFGESTLVQSLRLEIRDLHQTEPANIHIWEISIQK